ncbi:MAG: sodium:proton antiporter, partial [Amphiplicatus sp.]
LAPPDAGHDAAHDAAGDLLHQAADVIYSNPLPHVLILTAIVVGVATTAVGLALAVRIREAYGTVEEDELEAADDIAEFGHDLESGARA